MPTGCGTWPALWLVAPQWPNMGEIDIFEGVHTDDNNKTLLHTSTGCKIGSNDDVEAGSVKKTNCDAHASGNSGCNYTWNSNYTFGSGFNKNKGGVVIIQWTKGKLGVGIFFCGNVLLFF